MIGYWFLFVAVVFIIFAVHDRQLKFELSTDMFFAGAATTLSVLYLSGNLK